MACSGQASGRGWSDASGFWDALAPYHWRVENIFMNVPSLRLILGDIREPVLVIGAGQGLIVEELLRLGLRCDGVDLSPKMIEYAKLRRDLDLVHANASAMPFVDGTYETVLVASGVIDLMADLQEIETVLREANRVMSGTGNTFVAFYRFSAAQTRFMTSLGLLRDDTFHMRPAFALHRLGFGALVAQVAKMARISTFQAFLLCISTRFGATKEEHGLALTMRQMLAEAEDPDALLEVVPEAPPYRDKSAIGRLLDSLSMQIEDWQASSSCYLLRVSHIGEQVDRSEASEAR